MKLRLLLLACAVATTTLSPLRAAVPLMTSYQGRVRVAGANFTGTGQFKFALIANPGGASLWSNDGTSVNGSEPAAAVSLAVADGLFTVLLGDVTLPNMRPLTADLFAANAGVSLRVWFDDGVNGSSQLAPDTILASVPYALSASVAESSITGAHLAPGAIDPGKLASANAPAAGRVLTYDGTGFNWADPVNAGSVWSLNGTNAYYNGGRIGIGTPTPTGALQVSGGGLAVTGASSPYTGAGAGVFLEHHPLYGGLLFAYDYATGASRHLLLNSPGGNVGIGTLTPAAPLEVNAVWNTAGTAGLPNIRLSGPRPTLAWVESAFPAFPRNSWIAHLGASAGVEFWHREESGLPGGDTGWIPKVTFTPDGGINYAGRLEKLDTLEQAAATVRSADFLLGHSSRRGTPGRALVDWKDGAGDKALVLNWADDWPKTIIGGSVTEVKSLRITGGADLAEPFAMSQEDVPPGAVVVIDEQNAGKLRMSRTAYDKKVAGIVSGANGIRPGIAMTQEDHLGPGENVALKVDAFM